MIECLVLAASLCLNETASVTAVRHGFFTGAEITIKEVKITSELDSDNVGVPNKSLWKKLCDGGDCLYFNLRCNLAPGINCRLEYVVSESTNVRRISVAGTDRDQMTEVLSRISLLATDHLSVRMADLGFEAAIKGLR